MTTVPINYTSPGVGYLEVMVTSPSGVSAYLVVNSAPISLQNVVNVIPINAGDTINEIVLNSTNLTTVPAALYVRLLPIPGYNVYVPPPSLPFVALTTSTTVTVPSYVNSVLVVAVGGGGAGGGAGYATVQAGNGGDTVVTNGNQTITAGGGQGGWSGNYSTATVGAAGLGGTGYATNVPYYQVLSGLGGNTGVNGTALNVYIEVAGATIPSGYTTAIYQVLSNVVMPPQIQLSIPSFSSPSGAYGYGAGGAGYNTTTFVGGGGGGSGAVVVGLMSSGTFNITIGEGGVPSTSTEVSYGGSSTQLAAYGTPGVVYLGYVF
ncbi:MAG: hypothetical protein QXX15_02985 [Desulfurococcaceae archaeon]